MAHTIQDKKKLLDRVQRILGQINALKKSLENENDCTDVLRLIASARGAMNGLMAEVLEGHVRMHVLDPNKKNNSSQSKAAEQLIDVLRAYLK